jgi:hypothetical protein
MNEHQLSRHLPKINVPYPALLHLDHCSSTQRLGSIALQNCVHTTSREPAPSKYNTDDYWSNVQVQSAALSAIALSYSVRRSCSWPRSQGLAESGGNFRLRPLRDKLHSTRLDGQLDWVPRLLL